MHILYEILSQHMNTGLSCHKLQTFTSFLPSMLFTILWAGIFAEAECFYEVGSEIK